MVGFPSSYTLRGEETSNKSSFLEESYDVLLSTPVIVISTSTISGEDISLAKFQDYHYGQEISSDKRSSSSHYKLSLLDAKLNSNAGSAILIDQKIHKSRRSSPGPSVCFCFGKR
jgi:hypothetical protein